MTGDESSSSEMRADKRGTTSIIQAKLSATGTEQITSINGPLNGALYLLNAFMMLNDSKLNHAARDFMKKSQSFFRCFATRP